MSENRIIAHPIDAQKSQEKAKNSDGTESRQSFSTYFRKSLLPIDRFDHRRGLKSLQIHQTVLSADGRIWSATPAGLSCYDGVNIYMFNRKHGLMSHGLRTLAVHSDNTLWIGTDVGFEVLDISGLNPVVIRSFKIGTVNCLVLQQNKAFIGTTRGLFVALGAAQPTRIESPELSNATIRSMLDSGQGDLWIIGARIGLIRLRGDDQTTRMSEIEGLIGFSTALALGPQGQLIVGGANGLVGIDVSGECSLPFLTEHPVVALLYYDNCVWLGDGNQLLRLRRENNHFSAIDCINDNVVVHDLTPDLFGNVWISTGDQALVCLSHSRNLLANGLDVDIGSVMCVYHREGGIVVGGSNGLINEDGQPILPGMTIWDIELDDFGKTWLATDDGLYCTVNPNFTIAYRHAESEVIAAPCRATTIFKNELYVSSIRGLAKIDASGVTEILDPDGDSLGYVYSLHVGPSGYLWIATLGRGLFRYDGDAIQEFKIESAHDRSNVYALSHNDDGFVFVAHDNFISRIEPSGKSSVLVDVDVAMAAWTIKCLPDNQLATGSSQGLVIYDTQSGKALRKISGNFDHLPWEFTTSRSLAIKQDKVLYCGLGSGLRVVRLDELDTLDRRPEAQLSHVDWRGIDPMNYEGVDCVSEGNWHLTIVLKTCWYLDSCSMRVRLKGFDDNWTEPSQIGPIVFTALPMGNYELEVELMSPIAGVGPIMSPYKFFVRQDGRSKALK